MKEPINLTMIAAQILLLIYVVANIWFINQASNS